MRSMTSVRVLVAVAAVLGTGVCAFAEGEEQAQATLTLTGKLVIPQTDAENGNVSPQDLARLTGTLQRRLPPVQLPYPEGYDQMTPQQQRTWLRGFMRSPEYSRYAPLLAQAAVDQRNEPRLPVAFDESGGFKVEGLRPAIWMFEARIPHARDESLSVATFSSKLELADKAGPVDLGELSLQTHAVLAAGDLAPDFTAQTYDGQEFKLSDYRGKYVLLDFWATWCGPCLRELPNLKAVYDEFGGDQFEIIGLSLDQTLDAPRNFQEKNPSPYVHGYIGKPSGSTAAKLYGVRGIPSIWLIGPDGSIVARNLRGPAIRKAVSQALHPQEQPEPPAPTP